MSKEIDGDERARFEAWARRQPKHIVKDLQRYPDNYPDKQRAGQYGHCTTANAWIIWQAALASKAAAVAAPQLSAQINPTLPATPEQEKQLDAVLDRIFSNPEPVYDTSVVKRIATQMGWGPAGGESGDAVAEVESWTNGSYHRNYKLRWIKDVESGTKLYAAAQPSRAELLTDAAHDVLAERQRQIAAEGWTPEHDDGHANDELSLAAACYALHGVGPYTGLGIDVKRTWPLTGWDWSWWKPKDRRRNLVKAGALILAEIERIDRKATS